MSNTANGHNHGAEWYEIRLQGHLESRWCAWFDGLSLKNHSDGTTIIAGLIADQAALHGLLQRVRDIGLPLVSITSVYPSEPDTVHHPARMTHQPNTNQPNTNKLSQINTRTQTAN